MGFTTNDLLDDLHPDWELDCQKNYVFYKVEDPTKRIRGLWFHDDMERQKLESALEKTLEEIRSQPSSEPQMEPQPLKAQAPQVPDMGNSSADNNSLMESLYPQYGLTKPGDNAEIEKFAIWPTSFKYGVWSTIVLVANVVAMPHHFKCLRHVQTTIRVVFNINFLRLTCASM